MSGVGSAKTANACGGMMLLIFIVEYLVVGSWFRISGKRMWRWLEGSDLFGLAVVSLCVDCNVGAPRGIAHRTLRKSRRSTLKLKHPAIYTFTIIFVVRG